MLNEAKLHDGYWREAVYIYVYIQNKGKHRMNSDKTPYGILFGRPASVKYFRVFGSKCYIKREDDNLGKFDSRTNEGILLGYSSTKSAYKCYNLKIHKIIESASVTVDDTKSRRIQIQESEDVEESDDEETNDKQKEESSQEEDALE